MQTQTDNVDILETARMTAAAMWTLYGVTWDQMRSKSKTQLICRARQHWLRLMSEHFAPSDTPYLTAPILGWLLNKDHSTIILMRKRMRKRVKCLT